MTNYLNSEIAAIAILSRKWEQFRETNSCIDQIKLLRKITDGGFLECKLARDLIENHEDGAQIINYWHTRQATPSLGDMLESIINKTKLDAKTRECEELKAEVERLRHHIECEFNTLQKEMIDSLQFKFSDPPDQLEEEWKHFDANQLRTLVRWVRSFF